MTETDPTLVTTTNQLEEAQLSLDYLEVKWLLQKNIGPLDPERRVQMLIVPALERIGLKQEQGKAALSQVFLSGRTCAEQVDTLCPQDVSDQLAGQPRLAIAVVEGNHMLGKRIVYSILPASGFTVRDYGRKTEEEAVVGTGLHEGDGSGRYEGSISSSGAG